MHSSALLAVSITLLASISSAEVAAKNNHVWNLPKFTSLVAFGDSYTDENRLLYFAKHNGTAPPTGWNEPESLSTADGGRVWVRYLVQYAGVNLYNYAVSGAVCSNDLTQRTVSIYPYFEYPDIKSYEIPAFIADSNYIEANGTKFEMLPPSETVYTIWIGTNDLGAFCFLTDSQTPGKTLVDYTDCVFNQIRRLYATGARYFVLNNVVPLQHAPYYGLPNKNGETTAWPGKNESNSTEISYRMMEQVATVNNIYKFQLPFEVVIQNSFPGARFALYDVHSLFMDIFNHPARFLNGTAPLNVTGCYTDCVASNCTANPDHDSFLWYNGLHPSEQTERLVAQNFLKVINGTSKYATYWSS